MHYRKKVSKTKIQLIKNIESENIHSTRLLGHPTRYNLRRLQFNRDNKIQFTKASQINKFQ